MRMIRVGVVVSLGLILLGTSVGAQVRLQMADGRVTLEATNVPVSDILREWARVGQVTVVDGDKLAGPPVTIQLIDVPEAQALATLLRSASGYLAAPRQSGDAAASVFDRILVLPTSTAPAAAAGSPAVRPAPFVPPAGFDGEALAPVETPMMVDPTDGADPSFQPVAPIVNPYGNPYGNPGVNPYVDPSAAPETTFDYANPTQLMQMREAATPGADQAPVMPTVPGVFAPPPQRPPEAQQPGVVPVAPETSPVPGLPTKPPDPTPPSFTNPYGLPGNIVPGSVVPPPQEPDRSKYANPYQPAPRPPNRPPE